MSQQPVDRIQDLFDRVVALPAEQRAAFLESACAGDAALRAEVESLLACDADLPEGGGEGLLNSPLVRPQGRSGTATQPGLPSQGKPRLPDHIGRYRVLRLLGEGGMGAVYEAEQDSPHRTVALKVIRPGLLAPALLKRFAQEVEILGRLHHPGIAQIHEAGVAEDGQPFFAMEFIRGLPLDEYARLRSPAVSDRMELLARVCDAVQHAHDQGVIHRDLKPANILVDETGQPKVLDFGVARATDADLLTGAGLTRTGQLLGTPSYMSPEQVTGDPAAIDRRADVYALGVILFELLAHRLPYQLDNRPLAEVARLILEEEPPRLGSLHRELRGDVETIVAKALAKLPARRYRSAADLAADLRRYLSGEPIVARRVGRIERLALWVRRRPTQAAACGLAALVLVLAGLGGGAAALWRRTEGALEREQQAKEDAERAKDDAERARAAERKAKEDLDVALDQHRVLFAHAAWRDYSVGRAEQLLLECAPQRRDWEWRYVYRLCHTDLLTLPGHVDPKRVAYSPDGRRLLTVSWDGSAMLWDASNGKKVLPLRTRRGSAAPMLAGAFSPDGRRVATGTWDGVVKVWDAATGKEVLAPKGDRETVRVVAFSRDGRWLTKGCVGGMVKIWDAATGEEIRTLWGRGNINDVAFSLDGTRLATACSGGVRVWDTATWKEVLNLTEHTREVRGVAYSPDGSRLATASEDGTAKVWDAASGKQIRALQAHSGAVISVAFSRDGSRLATAHENGTARLWDAATGQETQTIRGHSRCVNSVAFSPDGSHLATASADGTAKVWNTAVNQECLTFKAHSARVDGVAFSSDGTRLATASWDGTAKLWDAASGKEIRTLRGHADRVLSVAFSPDGRRLATACWDGTARLWDAVTGKEMLNLRGPTGNACCVAFSSDGSRLATAHEDGTAKVWDAATGKEMFTLRGHASLVHSVVFSPDDSRVATSSWDSTVKVWDAATGQAALTLQGPKGERLNSIAFSPDGRRVAAACIYERTARVWDTATGREVLILKGHTNLVAPVEFSPHGKRLATASSDGTAKVWDAATGQETLTLKGHSVARTSVVFSADGQRLATADIDGIVKIWDARPVPPPAAPPGK